jgi:hypothetical protein
MTQLTSGMSTPLRQERQRPESLILRLLPTGIYLHIIKYHPPPKKTPAIIIQKKKMIKELRNSGNGKEKGRRKSKGTTKF